MATRTWDGGAATQNWEDANNWSDNTVPVTGDTAIIPTGMGTINGAPSPDVLAQVTVQGDSALNVTLAATAFTFEGASVNSGSITGDAEFTGAGSRNDGYVYGNAVFSAAPAVGSAWNYGTIAGDAVFSYTGIINPGSTTNPFGTVSGAVSVTGSLVIDYNSSGEFFTGDTSGYTVSGDLNFIFSGPVAYNNGIIVANQCVFSGEFSYNAGTVTATATVFSGNFSYNGAGATINGETEFSAACSDSYPWNSGTINGDVVFSYTGTVFPGYIADPFGTTGSASVVGSVVISGDLSVEYDDSGALFTGDMTNYVITGSVQFSFTGANTVNGGTIRADVCSFMNSFAQNDAFGVVYGNCVFNTGANAGYIEGDCSFLSNSYNSSLFNPGILGDCSFESSSYNSGNIQGNCTFGDYCEHRAEFGNNSLITGDCVFSGAYSGIGTDGSAYATVQSGGVSFEHPTHNVCKYMNAEGVNHFTVKYRAALNHMVSDPTYPLFSVSVPPQPINLPFADILGTGIL